MYEYLISEVWLTSNCEVSESRAPVIIIKKKINRCLWDG